ncbi:MAG: tetratricopeptide repeat protein, partial [Acidobacteria bacterium]|nr:tetratricopeptide repeat protein [Acidobacteriota bacterium]
MNKHYTENPEAYQLYLKGRFYWNKRTGDAFKKSIEYFNQAIERDPNYALAYQSFYYAHWWLGTAYEMKGYFQDAIAEYQKAKQLNDDPYMLALLGHA